MKKISAAGKMVLNKMTVSNLNAIDLGSIWGGTDCPPPDDPTTLKIDECDKLFDQTVKVSRTCGP